jgi:hypothetical protein
MIVTLEMVYEKLVQLTEICDLEFKELKSRMDRTDRRMANHDAKIDAFIEDIIEMKRDFKHPV